MAYNQNMVFQGIGTFTLFTAPSAGNYFIDGKVSVGRIASGDGASSFVVLIKKNGSTVYTGNAGAMGFYMDLALAANDAITMVTSSTAAVDAALNAVKINVAMGDGL